MEACNREGNTKNEMKLLKARSVWCWLADLFRMVGVSCFCQADAGKNEKKCGLSRMGICREGEASKKVFSALLSWNLPSNGSGLQINSN